MLDTCDCGVPVDEANTQSILSAFHELLSMDDKQHTGKTNAQQPPSTAHAESENTNVYKIRFRPSHTIFMNGTNPLLLLKEFQALGDVRIVAYTDKIPLLDEINPEFCYTTWDIVLTTQKDVNVIQDVFIFVADSSEIDIKTIDTNVMIQIKDDGKGMDPAAIKSKAIEKGIISPNAELSEKECIDLIFAPGFSTAKEVTSVSGRGVGMDVVKRTIDALRGSLRQER